MLDSLQIIGERAELVPVQGSVTANQEDDSNIRWMLSSS